MPSSITTIIAGILVFGCFIIFCIGLVFAVKKFFKWMWKIAFYFNIKKNPDSLELINEFIDETPTQFKIEMLLLNEFSDKEVEGLVYVFKKRKRQLKGGFISNAKPKSERSTRKDQAEEGKKG